MSDIDIAKLRQHALLAQQIGAVQPMAMRLKPEVVLALLDRLEKAEVRAEAAEAHAACLPETHRATVAHNECAHGNPPRDCGECDDAWAGAVWG